MPSVLAFLNKTVYLARINMGVWTELLCCTAVPEVVLRHGTRAEFPENFHFFRFEELVRSTTAQSCENLLESTENEVESPSECRAAIVALLAILCISRSAFRMSQRDVPWNPCHADTGEDSI